MNPDAEYRQHGFSIDAMGNTCLKDDGRHGVEGDRPPEAILQLEMVRRQVTVEQPVRFSLTPCWLPPSGCQTM
jgi:hypothetical protein